MKINRGTTRTVFLIGQYAIKVPRFWHEFGQGHRWKILLRGILANLDEHFWWKCAYKRHKLCPVLWRSPLGFILVMRRAEPLSEQEYDKEAFKFMFENLPMDNKIENFGKLKRISNTESNCPWNEDRIVLVDYADSRYLCSDCSNCWKNR